MREETAIQYISARAGQVSARLILHDMDYAGVAWTVSSVQQAPTRAKMAAMK